MAVPLDKKLYEKARRIADISYDKPSAYKSGFIVKKYKEMGGKYSGESDLLENWFDEKWRMDGITPHPSIVLTE
jgi:hypothetical protein